MQRFSSRAGVRLHTAIELQAEHAALAHTIDDAAGTGVGLVRRADGAPADFRSVHQLLLRSGRRRSLGRHRRLEIWCFRRIAGCGAEHEEQGWKGYAGGSLEEPVMGSLSAAVLCERGGRRQQQVQTQAGAELYRYGVLQRGRVRSFLVAAVLQRRQHRDQEHEPADRTHGAGAQRLFYTVRRVRLSDVMQYTAYVFQLAAGSVRRASCIPAGGGKPRSIRTPNNIRMCCGLVSVVRAGGAITVQNRYLFRHRRALAQRTGCLCGVQLRGHVHRFQSGAGRYLRLVYAALHPGIPEPYIHGRLLGRRSLYRSAESIFFTHCGHRHRVDLYRQAGRIDVLPVAYRYERRQRQEHVYSSMACHIFGSGDVRSSQCPVGLLCL